jgi:hypothetical protein
LDATTESRESKVEGGTFSMMEPGGFLEPVAANLGFGVRQLAAAFLSQQRYDERREQSGSKLPHSKPKFGHHQNAADLDGQTEKAMATSSARWFNGLQTALTGQGSQENPEKGQTTLVSA